MSVRVDRSRRRGRVVSGGSGPVTLAEATRLALAEAPGQTPGPRAWALYWPGNKARVMVAVADRLDGLDDDADDVEAVAV